MKDRMSQVGKLVLATLCGWVFVSSCSKAPELDGGYGEGDTTSTEKSDYDAVKGFEIVDKRRPVSAILLDEPKFKVNGAQVGLQDYLNYETPVISYLLPLQADYVEILRCLGTVSLKSEDGTLTNLEAGASSVDQLTDILKNTNFWKQAEDSGGCTLVASEFDLSLVYHDETAPSETVYYLMRACVEPVRLADSKFTGKRNCSHQVGVTARLENYTNKRDEKTISVLSEAEAEKRKMDALGRQIYMMTVDLNNALFKCEKEETERRIRVQRRAAITNVIGAGLSFGASIYAASINMTAKQVFKQVWEGRNKIAGGGANIGGVLMDLTSQPDDFPKSCVEQKKLVASIFAVSKDFKLAHQKYATLLESIGR